MGERIEVGAAFVMRRCVRRAQAQPFEVRGEALRLDAVAVEAGVGAHRLQAHPVLPSAQQRMAVEGGVEAGDRQGGALEGGGADGGVGFNEGGKPEHRQSFRGGHSVSGGSKIAFYFMSVNSLCGGKGSWRTAAAGGTTVLEICRYKAVDAKSRNPGVLGSLQPLFCPPVHAKS
ncbi:hypothetical protein VH569_28100 [Azospirillum sp. 11R-A]|uniref:hypothetical protein n=1 Tax=Azospirillum sp. 11R-A TaxID=3111634 RepID=UPI003C276826